MLWLSALLGKVYLDMNDYKPLKHQKDFHDSEAMFRALVGGVGSGKTTGGCFEAVIRSLDEPRNVGVVCRQHYLGLKSTRDEFLDLCPSEKIYKFNKTRNYVLLKNGSIVYFKSLDKGGIERLKCIRLGFFYIDDVQEIDECDFDILAGTDNTMTPRRGRLRLTGIKRRTGFVTGMVCSKEHWVYRRFVEQEHKDYFLTSVSTRDNPYLPEGYIEDLARVYPSEWIAHYVNGTPTCPPLPKIIQSEVKVNILSTSKNKG